MPIRSMTGFGVGSASTSGLRLVVELRSLNNRHADVRMRLPAELGTHERELRRKVLETVRRGRVDVSLSLAREADPEGAPGLNRPLLQAILTAGEALRTEFGVAGDLDVGTLLSVPGMVRAESPEASWDEPQIEALHEALEGALRALDEDRRREGAALRRELLDRMRAMTALTAEIRAQATAIPSTVRDRLLDRLKALAENVELDEKRVAQEAVLLADRSDVTEEIVRLEGHIEQASSLLEADGDEAVGKRLEFLVQEIMREANTIGSKSPTLEMSRAAMEVKAEVEKVREQAQNLE